MGEINLSHYEYMFKNKSKVVNLTFENKGLKVSKLKDKYFIISTNRKIFLVSFKEMEDFFQIFVAFSEYMN